MDTGRRGLLALGVKLRAAIAKPLVPRSRGQVAAKARASDAGIDLLRLIDAGDHPWRSYVSIPAILTDYSIAGVSFEFRGTGQMAMPTVTDWRLLPLYRADGSQIDLLGNLVIDRWSDESIPREEGTHKGISLSTEQTYTKVGNRLYSVNVRAGVVVKCQQFFGQLPLSEVTGFHDEIRDEFKTRGFTTETVSFADLERDWRPISSAEALAVQKVMDVVVSSIPERFEVQERGTGESRGSEDDTRHEEPNSKEE